MGQAHGNFLKNPPGRLCFAGDCPEAAGHGKFLRRRNDEESAFSVLRDLRSEHNRSDRAQTSQSLRKSRNEAAFRYSIKCSRFSPSDSRAHRTAEM